jgi:hypothetical protein
MKKKLIKEFYVGDPEERAWATYAHYLEKGYEKLKDIKKLDKLKKTLISKASGDTKKDQMFAAHYFLAYRKYNLGLPLTPIEKKLLKRTPLS